MVYENAIFTIPENQRAEFIATAQRVGGTFTEWPGCTGVKLLHCVEVPERFILVIDWESVDEHMAFRASPGFEQWRDATAGYREVPVDMTHYEVVASH
jgi:heme-degrading monooxygenase HmoA